jgi:hypothetical protein
VFLIFLADFANNADKTIIRESAYNLKQRSVKRERSELQTAKPSNSVASNWRSHQTRSEAEFQMAKPSNTK